MKYKVNDNCIGCGFCVGTCPLVFTMSDEGRAVADENEVPAEAEASAEEAMRGCPVAAIEQAD